MAAIEAAPTPSAAEIVERERRTAPRAGLAALAAAVLGIVAGIAPQAILSGSPHVYLVDALKDAAGQRAGQLGLRAAQILFIDDHGFPLLLAALAQALSVLALGAVLLFLLDAAIARGAAVPALSRLAVMFGVVAMAVGSIGVQIAIMIRAHDFATSADHGTAAAHDVLRSGVVVAASGVELLGSLSLAGGFVLVALAAMRVGLLTRFIGILGAIVGVLVVLGSLVAGGSAFIVQSFWLLMVALLLFQRWPQGQPPAWTSGEARPWPSQQEIAEQRARARAARQGGGAASREPAAGAGSAVAAPPADAAASEAAGTVGAAAARKKKRKRR